jgi:arylsulfatase A-like enzyme
VYEQPFVPESQQRPGVTAWARFGITLGATLLGCVVLELVCTWPAGSAGAGFIALLASQVFALSVLWILPCAAISFLAAGALTPVLFRDEAGRTPAYVPLIPVALVAALVAGTTLHRWISGAVVHDENAHRVLPVVEVMTQAVLLVGMTALYRALRPALRRIPDWVRLGSLAVTPLAAWVYIHFRVPALAEHELFAPVVLASVVALATTVIRLLPDAVVARVRYLPTRRVVLLTSAGLLLASLVCLIVAGRAGIAQSAARAELQDGVVVPRLFATLQNLSDRDRDGFTSILGGLDCDDSNADIHPFAHDVPGDGIDQDCFDGDSQTERAPGLGTPVTPAAPLAQNAILITIDAARADAFGFAGAAHPTPIIDAMASAGTVFTHAYSQAAMTRRSLPSLLFGRYPSRVVWERPPKDYKHTLSSASNRSLADIAKANGIATGLFLPFGYKGLLALGEGFETRIVLPLPKNRNADKLVDAIIKQVRAWHEAGKRFFLWVHFYEPHHPYRKQPEFEVGDTPQARYWSEVRYVDAQIGRLQAELDTSGLAPSTAMFVTADHGEEFGEHGGAGHGKLFVEHLHVPLVMRLPGVAPRQIAEPVGLIDIAPTILEVLGIAPMEDHDGTSLVAAARDGSAPVRPYVISELIPELNQPGRTFSIIDGRWQLLADYATASRALFDLDADPLGTENCVIEHYPEGAAVERQLRSLIGTQLSPIEVRKASPATARIIQGGDGDVEEP